MRDIRAVAFLLTLPLCCLAPHASAQIMGCSSITVPQISIPLGMPFGPIAFSGVVKTSFEQRLYDGNLIHSVTTTREARDSAGRIRNEYHTGCSVGEDGQLHSFVSVTVHDPVARTSTSWQEGASLLPKTAQVFHQPKLVQPPQPSTPEEQEQQKELVQKMRQAREAQIASQRPNITRDDLGTSEINGIPAKGVRVTETYPAGTQGNDLPLVVVNETWTAVNIRGLVLKRVMDDPRRGHTVSEFEELKLGEPDPALFVPPADYKVRDITAGTEVMSGISAVASGLVVQ